MQGGDQGIAAGVCVAAQPEGSSQAEDVDSCIVADARGRGDQLVDGDDSVVELPRLPPPHGQTAFLHSSPTLISLSGAGVWRGEGARQTNG